MPKRILVVDDSMLIRHAVCRYLEDRGFAVESANDGSEAMELLKSMDPDLIITDLQMPNMNGRQFIDALKARPATANIPILIIAGKKSVTEGIPGIRPECVIYKDIDIAGQLQRALAVVLNLCVGLA
jgi:CheY-like chemotaxis protein